MTKDKPKEDKDKKDKTKTEKGEKAKEKDKPRSEKGKEDREKKDKTKDDKCGDAKGTKEKVKSGSKKDLTANGNGNAPPQAMDYVERSDLVKALKNQFAINRLVLTMLDLEPDQLCGKTIDKLKQVYEHLAEILRHQTVANDAGTDTAAPAKNE